MKIGDWLGGSSALLLGVQIDSARLDCLVLLEDILSKDRSYLLAHPETELSSEIVAQLEKMVQKRVEDMPLAYIRGRVEFYGREFIVNPNTLVPRPETETMIELGKEIVYGRQYTVDSQARGKLRRNVENRTSREKVRIVDVGTGCGAIAITMKLEILDSQVVAIDLSKDALFIARKNAKKLGADVQFLQGDLVGPIHHSSFPIRHSILLANLPYVPDDYAINKAASHEPKIAIFGGPDGLDLYRQMFEQISRLKHKPEYVLTESLEFQHIELAKIAKDAGYQQVESVGLIQAWKRILILGHR